MLKFLSSGLFVKAVIAMVITVGFAWGAVYYGIGVPQSVDTPQSASTETEIKGAVEVTGTITEPEPKLKPAQEQNPEQTTAPIVGLGQIMPMVMEQAEKINTVEIKDQAYLDVVSFSVSQRQYNFADAALQNISQAELRDTARSQIAIAMAIEGRALEAFDIIDTVEIDALRDVMRLQVIEALIVPEQLPNGLLRK